MLISGIMEDFSCYTVGDLTAFVAGETLIKVIVRQMERFKHLSDK